MSLRLLRSLFILFAISFLASSQPPPEVQKRMNEINNRPRYFWSSKNQAQYTLNLAVLVDGESVTRIRIPVAKAERDDIPEGDQQKVADYHFYLKKRGNRKFRGVSDGPIEGNFWIGLATDTEIDIGHSWVCGNKIILHEMLPCTVGKTEIYSGSGVLIRATWVKR